MLTVKVETVQRGSFHFLD